MNPHEDNHSARVMSQDLFGLPVDTDLLFSDHRGIYRRGVEKRQRRLLKSLNFINPFLEEGEKILHITTGCSPVSAVELILTGWIVYIQRRSLFVFTNTRIFHVPTTTNFSYRSSIAQILYGDCENIAVKGATLVVRYKNGKKETFASLASRERRKIRALLGSGPLESRQSTPQCRTYLCPRCTAPLVEGQFSCPACSLEFKNKQRARKLSIIYPGGGYFYTGHPVLGVLDAFVETYLSFLVLIAALGVIAEPVAGLPALVFLAALLVFEKALTVYHARNFIKDYIPKDRRHVAFPAQQQPQSAVPEPTPEQILSAGWTRTQTPDVQIAKQP